MQRVLRVVLVVFFTAAPAFAQQNTTEIRGRVLDPQQAVLPGVTVTVTNQETGTYRETVSNGDGAYFIGALSPGARTSSWRSFRGSRSTREEKCGSIWATRRRSTCRSRLAPSPRR